MRRSRRGPRNADPDGWRVRPSLPFKSPLPIPIDFLAEFGFAFLMFLSGLEVSFGMLTHSLRDGKNRLKAGGPVPLALLNFALTLLLAIGIGFALKSLGMTRNGILMGLILSTTSLGIVVPILKERGLNTTPYGQLLLVSSLISDFATLLLLSLVIGIVSHGFGVEILLSLVLLAAFLAAARLGQWAKRVPGLLRMIDELSHATSQLRVRGPFALLVILVALAQALDVELILGAFLAGAITSLLGGTTSHSCARNWTRSATAFSSASAQRRGLARSTPAA